MEEDVKNGGKTLKPYQFQLGNPGGPGRPKGKTIKERVREWLEEHPEDMESFVKHFVATNRDLAWQMLEGRPPQKLQGDPDNPLINQVLVKFINGKESNNQDS